MGKRGQLFLKRGQRDPHLPTRPTRYHGAQQLDLADRDGFNFCDELLTVYWHQLLSLNLFFLSAQLATTKPFPPFFLSLDGRAGHFFTSSGTALSDTHLFSGGH